MENLAPTGIGSPDRPAPSDRAIPAEDESIKNCIIVFIAIIITIITITASRRVSAIQASKIGPSIYSWVVQHSFYPLERIHTLTWLYVNRAPSVHIVTTFIYDSQQRNLNCRYVLFFFRFPICFELTYFTIINFFLHLHINFHVSNLSAVTVTHNFACFIVWWVLNFVLSPPPTRLNVTECPLVVFLTLPVSITNKS